MEPSNKGLYPLCKNIICSPEYCAKAKKCCEQAFYAYNSINTR